MKIGVLTSSRADYGIYLPLLKRLKLDAAFELEIIAFGTHLSHFHGYTLNQIKNDFEIKYMVESMIQSDSEDAIATAMGLTTIKFSSFWKSHANDFDLVFCLGDRYEMFSAVVAGIPFGIKYAHIHGGETSLGATDNVFRHCLTHISSLHFASTYQHQQRIIEMTGEHENVHHVGALSLDNLTDLAILSVKEFEAKWSIDFSLPTGLVTFHPETVNPQQNQYYANELVNAINELRDYQFLITMPNADTSGTVIRQIFEKQFRNNKRVFLVENLGTQSYFSAMRHCAFLLGNTSSGIIEAASFGKFVINIGDRQKGRTAGKNVIQSPITKADIVRSILQIKGIENLNCDNIYYNNGAATQIIRILKETYD